jgi:hypothetical protein
MDLPKPQTAIPLPSGTRRRRLVMGLALLLLSLLGTALVAELALRSFFSKQLSVIQDERSLLYRYDPVLGWFPIAGSSNRFVGTRRITVVNNRQGFRAATDYSFGRQPGIIFLGDSFVWGYDVEAVERFTEKLQAKHPEWSAYNFGVSGYGTDQEYILLQQCFDTYQPRVVFLMYCDETDDYDNSTNYRWGYYKPYCTLKGTRLELHGIPVPRSDRFFFARHRAVSRSYLARLLVLAYYKLTSPRVLENEPKPTGAIIRDMQKFVNLKGATLLVGLTWHNPPLQEFLTFYGIPYVDLSTDLRYSGKGYHWSVEGHSFVAGKIDEFLAQGKYMEKEPRRRVLTAPRQFQSEVASSCASGGAFAGAVSKAGFS